MLISERHAAEDDGFVHQNPILLLVDVNVCYTLSIQRPKRRSAHCGKSIKSDDLERFIIGGVGGP